MPAGKKSASRGFALLILDVPSLWREGYENHDRTGTSGLPANLDIERKGHGDDRARH
jgi:hypothetical protein